jgi:hypothetical protein
VTLPPSPVVAPESHSAALPPPDPLVFPLSWILTNAAAPVQFRAITEVAHLPPGERGFAPVALTFRPALQLALGQQSDGTWPGGMLAAPSGKGPFDGIGTITAVRRLLEYGWDRDTPPLTHARRTLFRLLAEDDDPAFLFELAGKGKMEPELVQRGRLILREAAAATLAQAGYETDPRLRGAARRILDRIEHYLRSPLAQRPWVRVGNKQVLAPEAAPPSIFALQMLAFMPHFRSENHTIVDLLYTHLTQPLPRQESVQLVGQQLTEQPHLVLGDPLPHRNAADADVPFALHWLELMARLQLLRRNEGWMRLFDRFLDDRDRAYVWHPHKGTAVPRTANPYVWHTFPLEPPAGGEDRWGDVTFRLGLIGRLIGRPIELV